MVVFVVVFFIVFFSLEYKQFKFLSNDSQMVISFFLSLFLTAGIVYIVDENTNYRKDAIVKDKDPIIIYSLKTGSIEGSFYLGSGSISSPYTAFQKVDGGLQKISIDSSAILKEDSNLSNQGYVETFSCIPGERASYLFLSPVDKSWCDIDDSNIILHVPKNTIMLDFKVE